MTTHSCELTPEQRLAHVAAILATGALRLKQSTIRDQSSEFEEKPESPQEGLESGANPRLSGSRRSGF